MEKFNRWSDQSTGINPFVPPRIKLSSSFVWKYGQFIFITPLALVRILLLVLCALLLLIKTFIGVPLSFIPFIGRLYSRITEFTICQLALWILGISTEDEEASSRRLGLNANESKKASSKSSVQCCDVILCNHCSFIDILYLSMRYSPIYTVTNTESAGKGLVQPCGLLSALYYSIEGPPTTLKNPEKLQQVLARSKSPVAIFPEGIRSNNKAILQFLPLFDNSFIAERKSSIQVHLICFKYDSSPYSGVHTVGNVLKHIYWLCFCLKINVKVIKLAAENVPPFPTKHSIQEKTKDELGNPLPTTPEQWTERMRSLFAAILRVKTVDLTIEDFRSFEKYWAHVTSGGKKPASDFTERKAPHEHAQWKKK